MKVVFNGDTKRFPSTKSYTELLKLVKYSFKTNVMIEFGENYKFYYIDTDGDIISITNQGDLDEAYQVEVETAQKLRLFIAKNIDEVRDNIDMNKSMLNQSMTSHQFSSYNGLGQLGGVQTMPPHEIQRIVNYKGSVGPTLMQRFSVPTKFAPPKDFDTCSQISQQRREQDMYQKLNTERLHGQYQYGANQMLLADLD